MSVVVGLDQHRARMAARGRMEACGADYGVARDEPLVVSVDVGGTEASTVAVTRDLRVGSLCDTSCLVFCPRRDLRSIANVCGRVVTHSSGARRRIGAGRRVRSMAGGKRLRFVRAPVLGSGSGALRALASGLERGARRARSATSSSR
jgi:hypothetical protein